MPVVGRTPETRMRSGLPCTILAAVAGHEREAISAVAPFTGVRIETSWRAITRSSSAVAPFTGARIETDNLHRRAKQIVVAPFTGARIETFRPGARRWRDPRSLPSRGRGSKLSRSSSLRSLRSRSLHGGADRNVAGGVWVPSTSSRSLHGGADRNSMERAYRQRKAQVAPFTGARIETLSRS